MADLVRPEAVRVGGVDERHAGVEGGVDGGHGLRLVGPALDRQGHGAEADRADGGVGEASLLHGILQEQGQGAGSPYPRGRSGHAGAVAGSAP